MNLQERPNAFLDEFPSRFGSRFVELIDGSVHDFELELFDAIEVVGALKMLPFGRAATHSVGIILIN